jgi:hypothetical protein
MKKLFQRLLLLFWMVLLLPGTLAVSAYAEVDPWRPDLRAFLHDPVKRDYVETMVDYHLRTDKDIQNALEGGFAAVFLFDGCSDNMNDPELSDLSYYRVSGVCLVIKLDQNGKPKLMYFNEDFGRQYLAKSERKEANKIVLYFGFKADTLPSLQLLVADSIEHQDDWYVLEDNPTHDTLTYWIKDSSLIKLDTIALRVDYLKTDSNDLLSPTCDTLQVVFKKEKAKSSKKNAQDNKRNNRRGRKNEKDIEQKNDTFSAPTPSSHRSTTPSPKPTIACLPC